jgi:hypothetical protein
MIKGRIAAVRKPPEMLVRIAGLLHERLLALRVFRMLMSRMADAPASRFIEQILPVG